MKLATKNVKDPSPSPPVHGKTQPLSYLTEVGSALSQREEHPRTLSETAYLRTDKLAGLYIYATEFLAVFSKNVPASHAEGVGVWALGTADYADIADFNPKLRSSLLNPC